MNAELYLAIVNPAAGGGRCGRRAPEAIKRLRDAGLEVDVAYTTQAGDATKLACEAQQKGVKHFISVGGDGTGYEIVNGLFPLPEGEDIPTLGFLPMGTGNSFLRDFTDQGALYAEKALKEKKNRLCDVIRLEHSEGQIFFINLLSLGFVADICATRNARFQPWGEFGYVLSVLSEIAHLKSKSFSWKVNGLAMETKPTTFLSINNSRFTGGKMMMAPHAATDDGMADLIEVGEMGRFSLLKAFPKIFKGTHVRLDQVKESKVRSMEFSLKEKIPIMVDGEVTRVEPQRLDVLPKALKVSV